MERAKKFTSMEFTLSELADILEDADCTQSMNEALCLENFAPIEEANAKSVSWIRGTDEEAVKTVADSQAIVILASKDFPFNNNAVKNKIFFLCDNPRLSYSRIVRAAQNLTQKWEIHPTAIIHPEAIISDKVSIGPYTSIGKATIGEQTIVDGHCFIHDNVEIGKRVHLHAHVCIGSDGFSFEWNEKGEIEKLPHIGECIIEDDVEIYPFANVDRGTLGKVRIGKRTQIDHYVHVGHNCTIGQNTIVTAGVVMCGGSHIGDNVWIGVHTTIKEKCIVGSHSLIGLNSLVTKNVPKNEVWIGSPARFLKKNN